ncbi:sensor histidine kinase [Spirosoma validum]|uniref:histidine kinase n=1 Tax=Spirosoma validum TaxID=2771355 RepID=A0A927B5N7_9BACT|nr:HAMP domain-containing sensor histidine kinase [Spirosoma validum]MBD2756124.1 HAMP domain-containing histidine kinase [Spirosoma validum]
MKLIHKTTRYLLLVTLPIALAGTFLLDYLIHQTIHNEVDELLISELKQVKENLDRHPPDARGLLNWDHNLQITYATKSRTQSPVFTDTTLVDSIENKVVPVRMLRATHAVGSHYYAIRLHQPYLEFNEIAHILSIGIVICFVALVALLLLIETLIFRRILQPFYVIIQQLKKYRIDQSESLTFPTSDVDEFTLLSQSLDEMTQRAAHQYSQQKQFTDNASHELQTPLSILSFDLDLLQQSDRLSEADLQRIQRSQKTIKRLSSMNQALLLLTKIDNHQFIRSEPISISELINKLIDNYGDYAANKGITLERLIKEGPTISMNRQLAFILFSNLIKNAIRHGRPNSSILVQISTNSFSITNEGEPLPFSKEELFHRFVRNQALPHSTGLGLAIVKEIANQYGMSVQYTYASLIRRHIFEVTF